MGKIQVFTLTRSTLWITFLLFPAFLLSCATQTFKDKRKGAQEISTIKSFSTTCNGRLEVKDFDEEYSGFRLKALPGKHSMRLFYRGRPELRDDLPTRSFVTCVNNSVHSATFETKPGHAYWFYVNEISDEQHEISVHESKDLGGVEGARIPADVRQLTIVRKCSLLPGVFEECFRP